MKRSKRAERRAVDHDGPLAFVVLVGVGEVEALREVVVQLDGPELPASSQRVLDHEVQLGAVEGGLALDLDGVQAHLGGGFADGLLRGVPRRVVADVLGRVLGIAESRPARCSR